MFIVRGWAAGACFPLGKGGKAMPPQTLDRVEVCREVCLFLVAENLRPHCLTVCQGKGERELQASS